MTFHPETTKDQKENILNLKKCLNCLKKLKNTSIIITMPGADQHYKMIYKLLKSLPKKIKTYFCLNHLAMIIIFQYVESLIL